MAVCHRVRGHTPHGEAEPDPPPNSHTEGGWVVGGGSTPHSERAQDTRRGRSGPTSKQPHRGWVAARHRARGHMPRGEAEPDPRPNSLTEGGGGGGSTPQSERAQATRGGRSGPTSKQPHREWVGGGEGGGSTLHSERAHATWRGRTGSTSKQPHRG